MGGRGSGRYSDFDAKATVEQYRCLDIRHLKRDGLLNPGQYGLRGWWRGDTDTGVIYFRTDERELVYLCAYRTRDDTWQPSGGRIAFDWTPCNYGGERTWFSCPDCGKRVAVLYAAGARFSCRHCLNLAYSSQQVDPMIRAVRRQQKVLKKLGAPIEFSGLPDKPKYMHWQTYLRLLEELQRSNQRCWGAFAEWKGERGEEVEVLDFALCLAPIARD